jgi:hypothetical protein
MVTHPELFHERNTPDETPNPEKQKPENQSDRFILDLSKPFGIGFWAFAFWDLEPHLLCNPL